MNNKMKRIGPIAVYLSREQVNALLYLLDCFPAADSNSMFASDTKYIIICRAVPVGSHRRGWANTPCSCGSPSGIHNEIQEILSGERTADFIDETRRYAIAMRLLSGLPC